MENDATFCYLIFKWRELNHLPHTNKKYREDLQSLAEATELTPQELESLSRQDVQLLSIQLIGGQRDIKRNNLSLVKDRVIAERKFKKIVDAFALFDIAPY